MMRRFGIRSCCGLLALAALAALEGPSPGADAEGGEKVYKQALRSTVWILAPQGKGVATGSGSLIDGGRKLVLTNYHVVGDAEKVVALFPSYQKGKLVAERAFYLDLIEKKKVSIGKVVVRDRRHDLALVVLDEVAAGTQSIRLARESVGPGQRVHSVGNPGGSGALWVYTAGTVRQVYRKQWKAQNGAEILDLDSQVVETQSPTNPGDSGGPLVNDKGELVAVTQGGSANAQLLSLFIDVSEVKTLLASKGLAKLLPPPAPEPSETPAAKPPDDSAKLEQEASRKLKLARQAADAGKEDVARERYREIIEKFPKTKAADEARKLLGK